jgi:septal ring factor EnvC (AmiA/AmiB activator)
MEKTKKFLSKNYVNIIFLIVISILVYKVYFVPNTINTMDKSDKLKIDSLSNKITELQKEQKTIEDNIKIVGYAIDEIDENISKIKKDRTKIRKKYNEEITRVDNYTDSELDSFFSNRYH